MTSKIPQQPRSNKDRNQKIAQTALMGVAAALVLSNPAFAQNDPGAVFMNLADMVRTNWARGAAILAVMFFGLMALSGRINMIMGVSIAVGIATMFGAPAIVDALSGT